MYKRFLDKLNNSLYGKKTRADLTYSSVEIVAQIISQIIFIC